MSLTSLEEAQKDAFDNMRKYGWKYLQLLERESINKPRDVVIIGKKVLSNGWVSSTNKWRLLERVAICSLELDDKQTAADCIKQLTAQFSKNSNRVRVLRGMFYETKDEVKKAQDEYDFILNDKNEPYHMMASKRRIALLIANKQMVKAIKLLCKYLKFYGSDKEGWKQLFSLYCDMHCYDLAKFCIEELITMQYDDYLLFQIYAEVLYNIGGQKNYTNALKYFSQAVLLSSNINTRSLFGIMMCIKGLKNKGDLSSTDKELINKCRQKIVQNYADSKSKLVDNVKNVLLTFGPDK